MAFCMYCGKKLEEGETCDCPEAIAENGTNSSVNQENANQEEGQNISAVNNQNQSETNQTYNNQNNVQFEQMKQKSSAFLKDAFQSWLSIVKAPATVGNEFVQSKQMQVGIGLIAFQAILTGIFGILICSMVNDIIGIGSSLFGASDGNSINLFLAFLLSVIGSLVFTAARVGLLYGGVKVFKGTADWQDLVCVCGVRAVGISLMQLAGIVIYFINHSYGVEIFALACVLGLIFMLPSVLECTGVTKDKAIYMILAVSVLSIIVLYILYKIGIPMYLPGDMKKGFKITNIFSYF